MMQKFYINCGLITIIMVKGIQTLIDKIRGGDMAGFERSIREMAEDVRKREGIERAIRRCAGREGSDFWHCFAETLPDEVGRTPKPPPSPSELKTEPY